MSAYRILRPVSSGGGYVELHAGRQLPSERPVFLARLAQAPESQERLAENLKASRGPAIPTFVELGSSADGLWAVCEGVEGQSLRAVMSALAKAAGFMTPGEGLAVIARVAVALEALHRQGLLHGDVCPSNVFVTASGEVQLHAAGVAPCVGRDADGQPARSEPHFLAPEQLSGPATSRSDTFRLGLMLYELAHGRPLWSGPSAAQAAAQFQGLPREKVQQVPEPWQTLLVTLLQVDPVARPTMHEVSVALEAGLRQAGWSMEADVIARLFARAAPNPTSVFAPEAAPPRLLNLAPLAGPALTPPTSTSSVVARITTKKMTREMLAVQRPEPAPPAEPAPTPDAPMSLEARVAALLVDRGRIAPAQVAQAQEQSESLGGSLGRALLSQRVVDEDALVAAFAELTRTPSITARKLADTIVVPEALALVPRALARATHAVPLGLKGTSQLMVAMRDPMDSAALEQLKAAVAPRSLVAVRVGERALEEALERLYPPEAASLATTDALSLVGPPPSRPALAPATELPARLVDALLSSQGQRGVQAQQLVGLVVALGKRMQLTAPELAEAGAAARTMVVAALAMGRLPHDVPKLPEAQEKLGCVTEAEGYFEALRAFPQKLPANPAHRALVLAFTFAAHAGEPRPSSTRAPTALAAFKAKAPFPPTLVDLLAAEVAK